MLSLQSSFFCWLDHRTLCFCARSRSESHVSTHLYIHILTKSGYFLDESAPMIKSVGCEYVLCGHSERRTLFADSDVNINMKVRKHTQSGMVPIITSLRLKFTVFLVFPYVLVCSAKRRLRKCWNPV